MSLQAPLLGSVPNDAVLAADAAQKAQADVNDENEAAGEFPCFVVCLKQFCGLLVYKNFPTFINSSYSLLFFFLIPIFSIVLLLVLHPVALKLEDLADDSGNNNPALVYAPQNFAVQKCKTLNANGNEIQDPPESLRCISFAFLVNFNRSDDVQIYLGNAYTDYIVQTFPFAFPAANYPWVNYPETFGSGAELAYLDPTVDLLMKLFAARLGPSFVFGQDVIKIGTSSLDLDANLDFMAANLGRLTNVFVINSLSSQLNYYLNFKNISNFYPAGIPNYGFSSDPISKPDFIYNNKLFDYRLIYNNSNGQPNNVQANQYNFELALIDFFSLYWDVYSQMTEANSGVTFEQVLNSVEEEIASGALRFSANQFDFSPLEPFQIPFDPADFNDLPSKSLIVNNATLVYDQSLDHDVITKYFGGFIICFAMLFNVLIIMHIISYENRMKLIGYLRLIAVYESSYWLSWLATFLAFFVLIVIVELLLAYSVGSLYVFTRCNVAIHALALLFFAFALFCLGFFVSSFVVQAKWVNLFGFLLVVNALWLLLFFTSLSSFWNLYAPNNVGNSVALAIFWFLPFMHYGKIWTDILYRTKVDSEYNDYRILNYDWAQVSVSGAQGNLCDANDFLCCQTVQDLYNEQNNVGPSFVFAASGSHAAKVRLGDNSLIAAADLCYSIPSTADSFGYLFGLGVFYLFLAFYFGQVFSSTLGGNMKWSFLFDPSYYGWLLPKSWRVDSSHKFRALLEGKDEDVPALYKEQFQSWRDNSIRLYKLTKNFATGTAYKEISLNINRNEVLSLLGPNGAGKTTLINTLIGLHGPTFGSLFLLGYDHADLNDIWNLRQRMSVCFQENILFEYLTVKESVQLIASQRYAHKQQKDYSRGDRRDLLAESNQILALKAQTDKDDKNGLGERELGAAAKGEGCAWFCSHYNESISAIVANTIRFFELNEFEYVKTMNLSGGTKRRLCLALTLLGNPDIIFGDEITTGMDPTNRILVMDAIKQLRKDRIIVVTTHSLSEADYISTKVGILSNGRLRALGSSLFLKNRFGMGYRLTMTMPAANANRVQQIIKSLIPKAEINVGATLQDSVNAATSGVAEQNTQANQFQVQNNARTQQTAGLPSIPANADSINANSFRHLPGQAQPSLQLSAHTNSIPLLPAALPISNQNSIETLAARVLSMSVAIPKSCVHLVPPLLNQLENGEFSLLNTNAQSSDSQRLQNPPVPSSLIRDWGISNSSLEEVFLRVCSVDSQGVREEQTRKNNFGENETGENAAFNSAPSQPNFVDEEDANNFDEEDDADAHSAFSRARNRELARAGICALCRLRPSDEVTLFTKFGTPVKVANIICQKCSETDFKKEKEEKEKDGKAEENEEIAATQEFEEEKANEFEPKSGENLSKTLPQPVTPLREPGSSIGTFAAQPEKASNQSKSKPLLQESAPKSASAVRIHYCVKLCAQLRAIFFRNFSLFRRYWISHSAKLVLFVILFLAFAAIFGANFAIKGRCPQGWSMDEFPCKTSQVKALLLNFLVTFNQTFMAEFVSENPDMNGNFGYPQMNSLDSQNCRRTAFNEDQVSACMHFSAFALPNYLNEIGNGFVPFNVWFRNRWSSEASENLNFENWAFEQLSGDAYSSWSSQGLNVLFYADSEFESGFFDPQRTMFSFVDIDSFTNSSQNSGKFAAKLGRQKSGENLFASASQRSSTSFPPNAQQFYANYNKYSELLGSVDPSSISSLNELYLIYQANLAKSHLGEPDLSDKNFLKFFNQTACGSALLNDDGYLSPYANYNVRVDKDFTLWCPSNTCYDNKMCAQDLRCKAYIFNNSAQAAIANLLDQPALAFDLLAANLVNTSNNDGSFGLPNLSYNLYASHNSLSNPPFQYYYDYNYYPSSCYAIGPTYDNNMQMAMHFLNNAALQTIFKKHPKPASPIPDPARIDGNLSSLDYTFDAFVKSHPHISASLIRFPSLTFVNQVNPIDASVVSILIVVIGFINLPEFSIRLSEDFHNKFLFLMNVNGLYFSHYILANYLFFFIFNGVYFLFFLLCFYGFKDPSVFQLPLWVWSLFFVLWNHACLSLSLFLSLLFKAQVSIRILAYAFILGFIGLAVALVFDHSLAAQISYLNFLPPFNFVFLLDELIENGVTREAQLEFVYLFLTSSVLFTVSILFHFIRSHDMVAETIWNKYRGFSLKNVCCCLNMRGYANIDGEDEEKERGAAVGAPAANLRLSILDGERSSAASSAIDKDVDNVERAIVDHYLNQNSSLSSATNLPPVLVQNLYKVFEVDYSFFNVLSGAFSHCFGRRTRGSKPKFDKKVAVNNVSFHIKFGECFGLLGENGAGKTTTISMLSSLISISSGKVFLAGHDITTQAVYDIGLEQANFEQKLSGASGGPQRSGGLSHLISICPQLDYLDPELTVEEHLLLYIRLANYCLGFDLSFLSQVYGSKSFDEIYLVRKISENIGLDGDSFRKQSKELSGGQKRRLMIGISICSNPLILLLDEPSSATSPDVKADIWSIINKQKAIGRAVILTTHAMEEAQTLSDRIAIMVSGKIEAIGTPQSLQTKFGLGLKLFFRFQNVSKAKTKLEPFKLWVHKNLNKSARFFGIDGLVVTFLLPLNKAQTEQLTQHFKHLQDEKGVFEEKSGQNARIDEETKEGKFDASSSFSSSSMLSMLQVIDAERTAMKRQFGIVEFGIGQSSLDEVFVQVSKLARAKNKVWAERN